MLLGMRLVRSRMKWGPVTRLHLRDVERLTGVDGAGQPIAGFCGVYGLRQLLCCHVLVYPSMILTDCTRLQAFLLGLDLDANKWELVHSDQAVYWKPESGHGVTMPVELAPHLFLPQTNTHTLQ